MPITFDSLDELKDFYKHFKLMTEKGGTALLTVPKTEAPSTGKRKPGRPPKAKSEKTAIKKADKTPKKRGRKPAAATTVKAKPKATKLVKGKATTANGAGKTRATKNTAKAAPKLKMGKATTAARPKGRPKAEGTLTSKIQAAIQNFVSHRKAFTANDVYAELSKKDKSINKQSVITSVLKQMNTTFSKVSVKERPGQGPRPVKVYTP